MLPIPKPPPNEKACRNDPPRQGKGSFHRLFALVHKVLAPFVGVSGLFRSESNHTERVVSSGRVTFPTLWLTTPPSSYGDVANRGNARLFFVQKRRNPQDGQILRASQLHRGVRKGQ